MAFTRVALVVAAALAFAACEEPREAEAYKTVEITPFLGTPVLGNADAPVEITEYASTTCGHCLAFHEQVFPELKAKYIDTGKAKLAYVVLPTPPAELSAAAGAIARCAGDEKFFDVIGDFFASQRALIEARSNPWRVQKIMRDIGSKYGLSADQVGTCIDDKPIDTATRKFIGEAPAFVTTTPTLLIGGADVDQTIEALSAAIEAELAKTAEPAPAAPQ